MNSAIRTPNDHILDVLHDALEEHRRTGDKNRVMAYSRAIAAVRKHPTRLNNGTEAKQLKGIADGIARRIDDGLNLRTETLMLPPQDDGDDEADRAAQRSDMLPLHPGRSRPDENAVTYRLVEGTPPPQKPKRAFPTDLDFAELTDLAVSTVSGSRNSSNRQPLLIPLRPSGPISASSSASGMLATPMITPTSRPGAQPTQLAPAPAPTFLPPAIPRPAHHAPTPPSISPASSFTTPAETPRKRANPDDAPDTATPLPAKRRAVSGGGISPANPPAIGSPACAVLLALLDWATADPPRHLLTRTDIVARARRFSRESAAVGGQPTPVLDLLRDSRLVDVAQGASGGEEVFGFTAAGREFAEQVYRDARAAGREDQVIPSFEEGLAVAVAAEVGVPKREPHVVAPKPELPVAELKQEPLAMPKAEQFIQPKQEQPVPAPKREPLVAPPALPTAPPTPQVGAGSKDGVAWPVNDGLAPPAAVTVPAWDPFRVHTLPAGSFDIVMVIDKAKHEHEPPAEFRECLRQHQVDFAEHVLAIGHVVWVARPHGSKAHDASTYVVLDYIGERRHVLDLAACVSPRNPGNVATWRERMWRYAHTGLPHKLFLLDEGVSVEALADPGDRTKEQLEADAEAVRGSMRSTNARSVVAEDFNLHPTQSYKETAEQLAHFTRAIERVWAGRPLHYLLPDQAPARWDWLRYRAFGEVRESAHGNGAMLLHPLSPEDAALHAVNQGAAARCHRAPHVLFTHFNVLMQKSEHIVVRDLFVRMPMAIHGVSLEKARFVADMFGTPHALNQRLRDVEPALRGKLVAEMCKEAEEDAGVPLGTRVVKPDTSSKIAQVFAGEVGNRFC
ncbi:Crossover junction endonuclease mus81 [Blastocladiella emersonii ATCC 22665]|nr:Crossover junction endonuclease mus81 [Blastocladiella emersonii ATCC 22665]